MRRQASFIPGYGRFYRPQEEARWKIRHMEAIQKAFSQGVACLRQGRRHDGLFWLQRAEALSGRDDNISFTCAVVLLENGDVQQALPRLETLWTRYGLREAGLALAGGCFRGGRTEEAVRVMGQVMSCNSLAVDHYALADSLSFPAGLPGWMVLSNSGEIRLRVAGEVELALDGRPLGRLTAGLYDLAVLVPDEAGPWWRGQELTAACDGQPLLGSPLDVGSVTRCQSLVTAEVQGVRGWLWYPGEPDFLPSFRVEGHEAPLRAETLAEGFSSTALLQRPRGFYLSYVDWPRLTNQPTSFYDQYGRLLMGAPLDPALVRLMQQPEQVGSLRKGWTRQGCRAAVRRGRTDGLPDAAVMRGCAIIIPVYRGEAVVRACLESVMATAPASSRIIVVDDASPEKGLRDYLEGLAGTGRVKLHRHRQNGGFVASINTGLEHVPAGWDVILLNSDTLVFGNWVERLCHWLRRERAGTVTPFSNAGGLTAYPARNRDNPAPDPAEAEALDGLFRSQAEATLQEIDLPTANGFCMGISAACLAAVGTLNRAFFAQGYAEENEFCLRASEAGFRHLVGMDVYVLHYGHCSFGAEAAPLLLRNLEILNRLYPGYDEAIQRWKKVNPLRDHRRMLDWRRIRQHRADFTGAVVLLQHRGGGGVARAVREQAARLGQEKCLPIILEPIETGCRVVSPIEGLAVPNLVFDLPGEQPVLLSFLREMGVHLVIWHHMLGHETGLRELHHQLDVPYDVYVHDHVWFCPRIALLDRHGRYCGEPSVAGCVDCLSGGNVPAGDALPLPDFLARSETELVRARRVVAPSEDAARRLMRHIASPINVHIDPLEDDRQIRAGGSPARGNRPPTWERPLRILVLGGISRWKGYDVLLSLGKYIQQEALPLRLILMGGTHDDDACLDAGIEVTGPYDDRTVLPALQAVKADVGFITSIAPETWCYTLGWLWKAGLAVVGFDIGASAERIRQAGPDWGQLVPLGLPADRLAGVFMSMTCRGELKTFLQGIEK
ncbi:glycosyltransferase [Bombella sp. TMW 2.2559]|uniref:Glycosyltransferase n=1 Tax=Bombella dulcis TaxID=2967339 RepID=A0ABT3WF06_9PROT|nr:glycosyltransferase [Bombella dulcis]MCX5616924.1 glycosyltransferase [Bombella dulcis]